MAYIVMAYMVMAYADMAYVIMAYVVIADAAMADVVMVYRTTTPQNTANAVLARFGCYRAGESTAPNG